MDAKEDIRIATRAILDYHNGDGGYYAGDGTSLYLEVKALMARMRPKG